MFEIEVEILKSDAVMAGLSTFGKCKVQLTDEHLASLSLEERNELLEYPRAVVRSGGVSCAVAHRIIRPTAEDLFTHIRARVEARVEGAVLDGSERAAKYLKKLAQLEALLVRGPGALVSKGGHKGWEISYNSRSDLSTEFLSEGHELIERARSVLAEAMALVDAKNAADAVESARAAEAEKEAASAREWAIGAFVLQHGTKSQVERLEEGVLPEEELLSLIREVCFAPLAKFDRYVRLKGSDLIHHDNCDRCYTHTYGVGKVDALTESQFNTLKSIQAIVADMPHGAATELREHYGHCDGPECKSTTRPSVSVEIAVFGFTLRLEYGL